MPATVPYTLTNGTPADASQVMAILNAVNAGVFMPVVTALPATPVDGQDCFYLADANKPVVWHLKYRAASPNTHKWEPVSRATPLTAAQVGSSTQSSANTSTYAALTNGPTIVLPLGGLYRAIWAGGFSVGATTWVIRVSPVLGTTLVTSDLLEASGTTDMARILPMSHPGAEFNAVRNAGDTIGLGIATNGISAVFGVNQRWTLALEPIRVG